jgi:hypothetical protein
MPDGNVHLFLTVLISSKVRLDKAPEDKDGYFVTFSFSRDSVVGIATGYGLDD